MARPRGLPFSLSPAISGNPRVPREHGARPLTSPTVASRAHPHQGRCVARFTLTTPISRTCSPTPSQTLPLPRVGVWVGLGSMGITAKMQSVN